MATTPLQERPEKPAPGRFRALVSSADAWHWVTLLAGFGYILVLMRHQWFFFDEWDFLKLDSAGLFAPHVGHWSTSPNLIYDALRSLFGLHSYYPFATLLVVAHLAAAHLVWRIAKASGANGWIATAATAVFIVLGSGSENILWAFQVGFVGAIAFGLLAVLLANRQDLSTRRYVTVTAISLFSLTWSGTSIPLVVATALVLWRRSGWRRAVLLVSVTGGVYLVWLSFAAPYIKATGGLGLYKVAVLMPLFIGVMFFVGFPNSFPIIGLGQLIIASVTVWSVSVLVRRRGAQLLPALSLGAAAIVFAVLTAYARATLSSDSGASSRYIYTIFLLTLPLMAVALTRLLRDSGNAIRWATVILTLLTVYNASALFTAAHNQAVIEQGTKQLMSASLSLYLDGTGTFDSNRAPDPRAAPGMDMGEVIDLYEHHYIDVTPFSPSALNQAKTNIRYVPASR